MKPILLYEKMEILLSDVGKEASIPSISHMINVQNKSKSYLSEDEGLYIKYGALPNSYPYKLRNNYTRDYEKQEIDTIVLENDYIKATFLPTLGGRLWSLIDKTTGENLLYTNDIIRSSNLAIKNAWFSGGVEWNVGIIGHSPFTTEQVFVGELKTKEGYPVLRIYEFERIRKVTYQIDFWLTEESKFLVCRMRVCNDNDTLVPMYWWSNIAVPEFKDGRIIVPANKAFTSDKNGVKKVDIPVVKNIDITKYCDIPISVDYFFDIKPEEVKFIANVNSSGYGLIQASTSKLRGRKLFTWGHCTGSDKWQEYLTNQAGPYIEIQAGIDRTQYGCIPMPPNTAWEWIEIYGAVKTDKAFGDYNEAIDDVKQKLVSAVDFKALETMLIETKETIGKKSARLKYTGSGYGALENLVREYNEEPPISPHLDFTKCKKEQGQWRNLLEHGFFDEIDVNSPPESFMCEQYWFDLLKKSLQGANRRNWYAHYQIGVMYLNNGDINNAKLHLGKSIDLAENCWAYHALAVASLNEKKNELAADYAYKATSILPKDLSLAKDCTKILLDCSKYKRLLKLIESYPDNIKNDTRIQMYKIFSMLRTGDVFKADELLNKDGGLEIADIREGEISITDLWCEIQKRKNNCDSIDISKIPQKFNFKAN